MYCSVFCLPRSPNGGRFKFHLVSLTVLLYLTKSFQLQAYDATPKVQTESGKVVGKIETLPLGNSVHTYLGIPYAEPPVGELRFAAPKPAKAWSGIRNATKYGASCPQPDYPQPGVKIPGEGT